jgi:hypothetical protein
MMGPARCGRGPTRGNGRRERRQPAQASETVAMAEELGAVDKCGVAEHMMDSTAPLGQPGASGGRH